MKVKIKKWNAVATWRWEAKDDTCGICRMPFDGCCPDCKIPGDDCPLWVNSQQQQQALCPMCRQEWQIKAD
eukprot:gene9939-5148_t